MNGVPHWLRSLRRRNEVSFGVFAAAVRLDGCRIFFATSSRAGIFIRMQKNIVGGRVIATAVALVAFAPIALAQTGGTPPTGQNGPMMQGGVPPQGPIMGGRPPVDRRDAGSRPEGQAGMMPPRAEQGMGHDDGAMMPPRGEMQGGGEIERLFDVVLKKYSTDADVQALGQALKRFAPHGRGEQMMQQQQPQQPPVANQANNGGMMPPPPQGMGERGNGNGNGQMPPPQQQRSFGANLFHSIFGW